MQEVVAFLEHGLEPALVWGLVPRFVGVLYATSFLSLAFQVAPLVGSGGIAPVALRLSRMREDFPGVGRIFRQPTLFWLSSGDRTVRALPWLGFVASLVAIHGGETGPYALGVCWLLLLSLDVCSLMFPWDCLLFEAGFLALLLPSTPPLHEGIRVEALPLPALAFVWRLLLLRLMWGFAKLKFVGTKRGDDMYLRGFLAWLPMPTPLGWWAQHAPRPVLRASYVFMWFVEVICPLLGFFPGWPRVVAALGLVGLMVGIAATGNWGFFNVGYGLLCIVLLDAHSSLGDIESFASLWATPELAATHALLGLLVFMSLVYFPLNSWCTQTWLWWPFDDLTTGRRWLRALLGLFRFLAPFRLVHAYGVFPPNSAPPVKMVPLFQGSDDGEHWHDFRFKFMPTEPRSRPPVVAPHHPRVDQLIIYAGAGMDDANYLSSILGAGKPYGFSSFSHASWTRRLAERLLEGSPQVRGLLADDNPFGDSPPRYVRLVVATLAPTTLEDRRRTGAYWQRSITTTLIEPVERDRQVWSDWLPPPECFHPDQVDARRECPALRAMLAELARGTPHERAVCVQSPLQPDDVQAFWDEVMPRIAAADRHDWSHLADTVRHLRRDYGTERLRVFERILERYAFALRERLLPYLYGAAQPRISKRSNFRVHMLLHEIILDGRESYERIYADPALAAARAEQQSDASALYTAAVFRYDTIRYHSAAMRLSARVTSVGGTVLPGIFEFGELLERYRPEGEFVLPTCEQRADGEWDLNALGGASNEC